MTTRHQAIVLALALAAAVLLAVTGGGCPPRAASPRSPGGATPPTVTEPAGAPRTKTLTVFAGSASKPALEELATLYRSKAGSAVEITFGGSGAVLTQFTQEQYGDLYIPGSDDFMDKAEKKDAVLKDTRAVLVHLVPEICVAKGNPEGIKGLTDLTRKDVRVVIGQPKSVCLGDIAESVLTEAGLWEKVKPRVASYASNCEETLSQLLLGEADAIIGWDVFARQHPDKVEAVPLTGKTARPRNIPAAIKKWSAQPEEAKAFIQFLTTPEAQDVFARHGYTVKPPVQTLGR